MSNDNQQSIFKRQRFFRDVPVGGFFRLDCGSGKGSVFYRGPAQTVWVSPAPGGRVKPAPGTACTIQAEAPITPVSLIFSIDE